MTAIALLLVETNGMTNFETKRKEKIYINFLHPDFFGYPINCTYFVYICKLIEAV
jgi:hypothetical protein